MKKDGKRLLAIVAAMSLMMTGCGSGAGDEESSTGSSQNAVQSESQTGESSDGESTSGKTSVTIACAAEPDYFYPHSAETTTSMDEVPILQNVYETLIRMEADGSYTPLLATDWEISEDGKVYTFHLRDDVYFHDGNKMTAEDVAYSLNIAPSHSAYMSSLNTCNVVDETTVEMILTDAYAPILNVICSRDGLIVEKAYAESVGDDGYSEAPIGTGPYKFVERVSGDHVTMVANENYWGEAPAIKEVNYKIITDANSQMVALESGDIDVLFQANISSLIKMNSDAIAWETCDASSIMAMQLNCKEGPAADLEFRKALQCGINKEEINIGVYEGTASMGDIPIPPAFSGYPEDGSFDTVAFDADAAKAHLEASGYNGEEFEIITVSGTKNESAAQIVQGQLINLGINCVVTAVDASSYFAKYKAGEYDASMRAGGISILDADGLYSIYNAEYTTGITGNSDIGIWNDELINLLKEGRVTVDEAARKSLYAQVCNIITENVYSVTLYYDVNAVAYNSDLQGVVPSQLVGLYYINDWSWK